jgi:DNA-binding response OmpR family regulator
MSEHSLPATTTIGSRPVIVAMVEDDLAILELVITVLNEDNIKVVACPLGRQAYLCIRDNLPKVVILDVEMPDVDGIQLFHLMRADKKTASIAVIFLTANPKTVRKELPNYEDMGIAVLPKPFDLQHLLHMIRAAVAD